MAKFELPIYGENDEIIKEYKTDIVRYGILEDAIKISEESKGGTAEELRDADLFTVFGVFNQIISLANGLQGNANAKN